MRPHSFKLDELPLCIKCEEVKTKNTICKRCREKLSDLTVDVRMKYNDIEKRARKHKQYDDKKERRNRKRTESFMGGIEQREEKKTSPRTIYEEPNGVFTEVEGL